MNRVLDIEYNKFPTIPPPRLLDKKINGYLNRLTIDLVKLAATYNIEEFNDDYPPNSFKDYPALRYLIPNTDLFKFLGGHPGKSKDSRKENSRVVILP